jgi:hypothetical protein
VVSGEEKKLSLLGMGFAKLRKIEAVYTHYAFVYTVLMLSQHV